MLWQKEKALFLEQEYQNKRHQIAQYFDKTAIKAWEKLTSDDRLSFIRESVRSGREKMQGHILDRLGTDLSGKDIFDAGCGTGSLAMEFSSRNANVVAVDISPSLIKIARERFSSVNNSKEGYSLYDFELIKQDLINHFHIRQGEKISDPNFGTIIWDLLYEPFTIDVQEAIINDVTKIVNYDPRLSVEDITVDTYEAGITVDCTITFLAYNISEQLRFKFDQANGLV